MNRLHFLQKEYMEAKREIIRCEYYLRSLSKLDSVHRRNYFEQLLDTAKKHKINIGKLIEEEMV